MDNKKYIGKIQNVLLEIVGKLDKVGFNDFVLLRTEYIKSRVEKFGDDPDFTTMGIREKIYPGMYFYNLLIVDMLTTNRWTYWGEVMFTKDMSKDIPQVNFSNIGTSEGIEVKKMLNNCIDVPYAGRSTAFNDFIRYLLYCLKPISYYQGDTLEEKEKEAGKLIAGIDDKSLKHYYENFSLEAMLLYPGDYLGDLAAEYLGSNGADYYPTPHNVVQVMVEMLMHDSDSKFESVCDPCCGSSRMLLYASNKSLKVMGMDISKDIINVSMVNAFLYVPWAVCSTKEIDEMINGIIDVGNDEELLNICESSAS